MFGEVETGSEIFMGSPNVAFERCKKYNVAGFSFGVRAFGRRSRTKETKLPVGVARMVANVLGVKKPPLDGNGPVVEILGQDWSSVDREEVT